MSRGHDEKVMKRLSEQTQSTFLVESIRKENGVIPKFQVKRDL